MNIAYSEGMDDVDLKQDIRVLLKEGKEEFIKREQEEAQEMEEFQDEQALEEEQGEEGFPVMRGTVACGPAPGVADALPLPMDHSIPSSVLSHCIDFQNTPEDGILNPGAFWPVAETEWHWKLVNFTAADW